MLKMVQGSDSRFTIDEDGVICRKAAIDGSLQVIVPEAFRREMLYNSHHPITAGNWERDERTITYGVNSTCCIWLQTSTATCKNLNLVAGISRLRNTDGECNYSHQVGP